MTNTKITMLVVCVFLVASTYVHHRVEALGEFAECFNTCDKECSDEGFGRTFCEMKCDADCVAKETKGMNMNILLTFLDFIFVPL